MTDNMTLEDGWDMGQQCIAITVCFRKMPPVVDVGTISVNSNVMNLHL